VLTLLALTTYSKGAPFYNAITTLRFTIHNMPMPIEPSEAREIALRYLGTLERSSGIQLILVFEKYSPSQ
jgi:hypothetical protein